LRIQTSIAVDATIGSSCLTPASGGQTCSIGFFARRRIASPITAFQKPITVQGSVTAKQNSNNPSIAEMPPRESVAAISAIIARMVVPTSPAKHNRLAFIVRPPNVVFLFSSENSDDTI